MEPARILLDTSFLLPIIGIQVREVEEIINKLWVKYKKKKLKYVI